MCTEPSDGEKLIRVHGPTVGGGGLHLVFARHVTTLFPDKLRCLYLSIAAMLFILRLSSPRAGYLQTAASAARLFARPLFGLKMCLIGISALGCILHATGPVLVVEGAGHAGTLPA
jgi:hypothetical protein